ncbi:MAG: 50S ribosomal protein L6 [Candidatus Abawacabacteria bacterium]|nr:50S ribosomal protein L6 [Candidatus Abawacabacteria bacterium]
MSRIGKVPLPLPAQVQLQVQNNVCIVSGPKGSLQFTLPAGVTISTKDNIVLVEIVNQELAGSLHGTVRTQLGNMVKGVVDGYQKELEIQGVGYRVSMKGKNLNLSLGFSHAIEFPAPEGIVFSVPNETQIVITGVDKALVGRTAATIRQMKKPEPYKGKGVRLKGEYVARKEGKKAAK